MINETQEHSISQNYIIQQYVDVGIDSTSKALLSMVLNLLRRSRMQRTGSQLARQTD